MTNEDTVEVEVFRSGPRLQFSLATLMVVVTVVSVLCALILWLGPVMVIVPMLAAGPVGGAIIVRIRKSKHDGAVVWWSGAVTMVLWGSVAGCGGAIASAADLPVITGNMVISGVAIALLVSPGAFIIGVLTSAVWKMVAEAAEVAREACESIVKRCGSGLPSEGE